MGVTENVIPAASVVLIRESDSGFEVLLLRRSSDASYLGGAWVFPGGCVEETDHGGECGLDFIGVAFHAAVRETEEECGVILSTERLTPMSLWVTPQGFPKRFSTYFFLAVDTGSPVQVDGREIDHFMWMTPLDALMAQRAGEMFFAPPNYITLIHLAAHKNVQSVVDHYTRASLIGYRPRLESSPCGMCSLYEEDEDYDKDNGRNKGIRHRLWIKEAGWVYERNF
ncbi:MAG: NUDIX hydrolase [Desulfobacteraceae bacterium]|jgi:8-oxo-dGTP pyrophosphatase MutT (NUDIX family)